MRWRYGALAESWLRRVDHFPSWMTWTTGLVLGSSAGLALAGWMPLGVAGAGFLLLLGVAGWLVWSGEPVALSLETAPPAPAPLVDLVEIPAGTFHMGSPDDEVGR